MPLKLNERRAVYLRLLLSSVFAIGCACYTARLASTPKLEAMSTWRVQGLVAVGVDPYVKADRQVAVFNSSLAEVGILPIQILIQNRGEQTIAIHPLKLTFMLPNGDRITPTEARVVASRFRPHYGRSFDNAAVAFGLVGAIVALSAASASLKRSHVHRRRHTLLDK